MSNLETWLKLLWTRNSGDQIVLRRGTGTARMSCKSWTFLSSFVLAMLCLTCMCEHIDVYFSINSFVSYPKKNCIYTENWNLNMDTRACMLFWISVKQWATYTVPLPRAKHILVVLSLYKMIYSSVDTNNAFGFNVLGPTVAAEWHYGYSAEWQIGMLSLDQIFRV